MSKTNLTPRNGNAAYAVGEPFECYVEVGTVDTNTYYGSSMVVGRLWRRTKLDPGDRIYALVGGLWVEHAGEARRATIEPTTKHPFEKVYLPTPEEWPLEKLEWIYTTGGHVPPPTGGFQHGESDCRLTIEMAQARGAKPWANGIDWIVEDA